MQPKPISCSQMSQDLGKRLFVQQLTNGGKPQQFISVLPAKPIYLAPASMPIVSSAFSDALMTYSRG